MKHSRSFVYLFVLLSCLFGCAPANRMRQVPTVPIVFSPYEEVEEEFEEEEIFVPEPPKRVVSVPHTPKKHQPIIVIDPGHGGKDLGTHSFKTPKYQEKSLNLSTALLVRNYLHQMGYHTMLTRKEDVFISLEKRAHFANKIPSHLFVSVHYNSAPNPEAEGIEVFYYRSEEDAARSLQSKTLAQSILKRTIYNTQAKSRGVKHGNLSVIRETTMPAVLIEGGFLTNPNEQQKLHNKEYIKKIALGIAKGIDDYLKNTPLTTKTEMRKKGSS